MSSSLPEPPIYFFGDSINTRNVNRRAKHRLQMDSMDYFNDLPNLDRGCLVNDDIGPAAPGSWVLVVVTPARVFSLKSDGVWEELI